MPIVIILTGLRLAEFIITYQHKNSDLDETDV
jgi:hypothetical protein